MTYDFLIEADETGQRYAYPTSPRGNAFFGLSGGKYDLSDNGVELDTTETAREDFLRDLEAAGLTCGGLDVPRPRHLTGA